jgi:uncharacterized protein
MLRLLFAVLLAVAALAPAAVAAEPPPGADWEEAYIATGDPQIRNLHADVFKPKGMAESAKAPVILTVSPYTNHSGSTAAEFDPSANGPNSRFYDFLEVGRVFERGYVYVMVDLPGFGGSDGCNDWGGPVEQAAVRFAVEWAASQPWSNGKVGLMGKSYDGWTGLMGIGQKPKGLSAVLSMEPVFSGYRYYYTNGVRLGINAVATTAIFQATDAQPGTAGDDPQYVANGAPKAYCYGVNLAGSQTDTEDSLFWAERNLLPKTLGSEVPLFLTQGFLETNTRPDGAFDVFNGMKGARRAWFGQFDHVRGWERGEDGEWLTGRVDFAEQMMRFFDHHLAGAPAYADPSVEVQSAPDGRWRAEEAWPPADAVSRLSQLRAGEYTDDDSCDDAVWSFSQPLPHEAHMAGEPTVSAVLSGVPRGNFVAELFDVAPDGKAILVSRSAWLMRSASEEATFKLYGQDWVFAPGHRLGVMLCDSDSWWLHVPTGQAITVDQATISIPWLTFKRDQFLPGEPTSRLMAHLEGGSLQLDPAEFAAAETAFDLPPALAARPAAAPSAPARAARLTVRARRAKRALLVSGAAPAGARVTVTVKRGRKRVARRTVTARNGSYRLRVKLRKPGRYSVTARSGALKASRKLRVSSR